MNYGLRVSTKGWAVQSVQDAIERLLSAVQTTQELENVYQFASVKICDRNPHSASVQAEIANRLGGVRLTQIEAALRQEPAPGHQLAFNDTFQYRLQRGTHIAWGPGHRGRDYSNYA